MAAGDSGNFAGGLLEVIESEALIKFSEANVTVPLVTLKGEPKADQITFIAYNSGSNVLTSADVAATAEGTVTPSTQLDTEKKTATLDMYSVMVPMYDEAQLSNADNIASNVGELIGNALASKADALLNALFDGFSNAVGSSTAALSVDNLFDALSNLKQNSAMGQPHAVLDPRQIWGTYGVHNDLVTQAQFAGAGIQDEGARSGFVSRIAGIDIHSSPEFTEASNAVKGGVFVSGALGMGYAGDMMRVEVYREGSYLRDNIIGSGFWGVTEIIDGYGVEVHTQVS
jgi:N4-gp56 family major capsid protein